MLLIFAFFASDNLRTTIFRIKTPVLLDFLECSSQFYQNLRGNDNLFCLREFLRLLEDVLVHFFQIWSLSSIVASSRLSFIFFPKNSGNAKKTYETLLVVYYKTELKIKKYFDFTVLHSCLNFFQNRMFF